MTNRVLTIDLHTHILPHSWPDLRARYGYGGFVQMEHRGPCHAVMQVDGKAFRDIEANCWDPHVRLGECDRDGVNVQVLSTVPVMFSYWAKPRDTADLARLLNDHIAEVVLSAPRRFIGLGTVPLQDPVLAIAELDYCLDRLGFPGVQIGTHVGPWNLDAPELFPFFEHAARREAAVFVHPWDMLAPERMTKYWLPWLIGMPTESAIAIASVIFGGVLERLPSLRIGFAHGGGSFAGIIGRLAHGFVARPDLVAVSNPYPPERYLGRFYVDSLTHDPEALRRLVSLLGADHVALGSDYPFPLGEGRPGAMIHGMLDLDEADRHWLLAGTALKFLRRDATDFQ